MLLLLYLIVWLANILCACSDRISEKIVKLSAVSAWVVCWIVFAGNQGLDGDALIYRLDFENGSLNSSDIGYELLKSAVKTLGVGSYNLWLSVIFAIGSVLIYASLKNFSSAVAPMYALSLGFLFPAFATAIRFFLAFSVVSIAFVFLSKGKRMAFLLSVLIAATFHKSVLFCAVVVIFFNRFTHDRESMDRTISVVLASATSCLVLYIFVAGELPFQNFLVACFGVISEDAASRFLIYTSDITRFGSIPFILIYCLSLTLSYRLYALLESCMPQGRLLALGKLNVMVNTSFCLVIPFLMFNLVFFRLLAFPCLLNAIVFGAVVNEGRIRLLKSVGMFDLKWKRCKMQLVFLSLAWVLPGVIGVNGISIFRVIEAVI